MSWSISLIFGVERGFGQDLAKCPTSPQLKQVALDGSIAGAGDSLGPGVVESLAGGSARNGPFICRGAGSIPGGCCDVGLSLTSLDGVDSGRRRCARSVLGKR